MTSPFHHRALRALAAIVDAAPAWRALLWLLLIAVGFLALTPRPPLALGLGWDKLNHIAAFTSLALCSTLGCAGPSALRWRWRWLGGLLAFGGLIELVQQAVPGRAGDWNDLLADAIGVGCGALVAKGLLRASAAGSRTGR